MQARQQTFHVCSDGVRVVSVVDITGTWYAVFKRPLKPSLQQIGSAGDIAAHDANSFIPSPRRKFSVSTVDGLMPVFAGAGKIGRSDVGGLLSNTN